MAVATVGVMNPPVAATELDATAETTAPETTVEHEALVEDELLVEEISIDGMCGVY